MLSVPQYSLNSVNRTHSPSRNIWNIPVHVTRSAGRCKKKKKKKKEEEEETTLKIEIYYPNYKVKGIVLIKKK